MSKKSNSEANMDLDASDRRLIYDVIRTRESCGLSQTQLSKLCGTPQPLISRIENGVHKPTTSSINRLLKPMGYKLAIVKDDSQ